MFNFVTELLKEELLVNEPFGRKSKPTITKNGNPTINRLQSDQTYITTTETIDWEKNVKGKNRRFEIIDIFKDH